MKKKRPMYVPDSPSAVIPAAVAKSIMLSGGSSAGTNIHLGLVKSRDDVPAWARAHKGKKWSVDLEKAKRRKRKK